MVTVGIARKTQFDEAYGKSAEKKIIIVFAICSNTVPISEYVAGNSEQYTSVYFFYSGFLNLCLFIR